MQPRMVTFALLVFGVVAFFLATLVLGAQMRRTPTREAAERLSRISHAFFWGGLVVPEFLAVVWPGLTRFDGLLGVPSLPAPVLRWILGVPLLLLGVMLASGSMRALKQLGSGMMAFQLTQRIVTGSLYERTRNPMSLGAYLQLVGVCLLVGSTTLLALALFAYIPAHAFNLVYFEEHELRARHGEAYGAYRQRVPFLVPRWR